MHDRIAEFRFPPESAEARGAAWEDALDRVVSAGFHAVLASDAHARCALSALSSACARRGLALWIAVAPDAKGAPYYSSHAVPLVDRWLVDDDDALDPRRPPLRSRPHAVEPDDTLADAWRAELESVSAAGVSGVVCRDPDRLPAAFWKSLIVAQTRTLQWLAWTPGLPSSTVRALIDSGFNGVCSSLAWWDGSSAWLFEERDRQRGAMQFSFPLDPFAIEPATSAQGREAASQDDQARHLRMRLWVGAIAGDALLVPASMWEPRAETATSLNDILEVNRWLAAEADRGDGFKSTDTIRMLSGPGAPITVIARANAPDLRAADRVVIVLVNPDAARDATMGATVATTALSGYGDFRAIAPTSSTSNAALVAQAGLDPSANLRLGPGEVRVIEGLRIASIKRSARQSASLGKKSAATAIGAPRLSIEHVTPAVDGGHFPVKRNAGDSVRVEADILIDGHESLAAVLRYRGMGDPDWREVRMEPVGNDRHAANFPLLRIGLHEFTIETWRDGFATYRSELEKKSAAGLDVSLEIAEGRLHVAQALAHAKTLKRPDVVRRLSALSKTTAEPMAAQVAGLLASQTLADMRAADARGFAMHTAVAYPVDAERSAASFASWYELFPRSQAAVGASAPASAPASARHGTFDDVIDRLPAVRAMGFDVLYFTPIHPIGKKNRKGRNNSLTALEEDPGSPYAIGSADGGHEALHPQLGTFEDFKRLREAAIENGLELALDFAIQCSPEHPWLKDHPSWFAWRPDGSLRYAENPPKKYEDIVNVDFYGSRDNRNHDLGDASSLWIALRDVILLWVEHGVRIFRVDNPHTKPLPFWEWMIADVRTQYPDVIFLSEAFTRPKLMYRLAKLGFSQSYSYFTWRHTKQEFIDYLTELTTTAPRDFFRPHFFVNTPDINPSFLHRSGRAGFLIRAALASTLAGLWGIYSGFELCEATPVPGKEEYLDSEKYQIRAWDWERPGNIIAEITALNHIRNQNPALHTHLNVRFHNVFDANILYFTKATEDRSNILLVAINLDPHSVHEADFEVPLWDWGLPDDAAVDVTDLLGGHRFRWQGKIQRMRLDPITNPYAIWRVMPRATS